MTMRPNRREQAALRAGIAAELPQPEEPLGAGESDCVHGCDSECLTTGGPSDCVYTCHPGRLAEAFGADALAWAEFALPAALEAFVMVEDEA